MDFIHPYDTPFFRVFPLRRMNHEARDRCTAKGPISPKGPNVGAHEMRPNPGPTIIGFDRYTIQV